MTLDIPPGEFGAYIFDCDGTLADTMPLHYQAWLAAVGRLGCDFPEDLFYSLGGVPAPGVIEFLNARYGLAMPVQATAEFKEALFEKLIPQVQPIPEVIAFMESLGGRYPLAVGSGGLKPLVLATLDALGIRQHFQAVVTYEDVAHGKPAPDTYLEAARQLGVEPARCLVFEDTPLGIESATAAGMQSVLVASGPVVLAPPD
jgi:HAD superfamily hydrolase (TIGR01509 family)